MNVKSEGTRKLKCSSPYLIIIRMNLACRQMFLHKVDSFNILQNLNI